MEKTVGVLEEDEVSQLWIAFRGYHHLLDLAFVASERIVGAAFVHFSLHVLERARPAVLMAHVDELAQRFIGDLCHKRAFEPLLFPVKID